MWEEEEETKSQASGFDRAWGLGLNWSLATARPVAIVTLSALADPSKESHAFSSSRGLLCTALHSPGQHRRRAGHQ